MASLENLSLSPLGPRMATRTASKPCPCSRAPGKCTYGSIARQFIHMHKQVGISRGSGSRRPWLCGDARAQAWPAALQGYLLLSYRSQRLEGLPLLGLPLPGASQGPLKSWRQALLTCWGPLGSWHFGKTWALRGQLRPCPAISENLPVNIPPLHALSMAPRAAVQEPTRYS